MCHSMSILPKLCQFRLEILGFFPYKVDICQIQFFFNISEKLLVFANNTIDCTPIVDSKSAFGFSSARPVPEIILNEFSRNFGFTV
jgi:hypothetical protein